MLAVEGRSFHSKYNPLVEAQRQLDQFCTDNPGGKLLFLINPGENYLSQVATDRGLRTVSLYTPGWGFPQRVVRGPWDREFATPELFLRWIETILPICLLMTPRFLFHPSYLRFASEEGRIFQSELARSIERTQKELLTTGFFSGSYRRNLRRNLTQKHIAYRREISKVFDDERMPCIVASGPSLEHYKGFLTEERDKLFLCSLPSSIAFLSSIGLEPDCVVTTDPGYWAGLTLDAMPATWTCPILAGTTSSLGSRIRRRKNALVLFSQSTGIEDAALGVFQPKEDWARVPERGTVAATAMEIIFCYTNKACLFLGFDLEATNQKSHVHPHPFDSFFLQAVDRFVPFETQLYQRGAKSKDSLVHYRNWFAKRSHQWDGRALSLNPGLSSSTRGQTFLPSISGLPEKLRVFDPQIPDTRKLCSSSLYLAQAKKFESDPWSWIFSFESIDRPRVDELLLQNSFFELKHFLHDPEAANPWRPSLGVQEFFGSLESGQSL